MTQINRHVPPPGVNGIDAYRRLLHLPHLADWTTDRQQEHGEDTRAYEAALAAFQSALRSEHVEGDGRFTAARRSRRVEKHLKALVKASRTAEQAAEALRTSYADHLAHVRALPGQRAEKAARKAGRRDTVQSLAAKSLHKTTTAAVHQGEAPAAQAAPDTGRPAVRGVADLWGQQDRRGA